MSCKNCDEYTRFIVLGCGHTGTSLISGILHRNGFWGCDVDWHYEPLHLTELCVRILGTKGSISAELRRDIQKFFKTLEIQSHGRWTLKDPRLSDVIDVIAPFIPAPYKIILNYRHPANTIRHLMVYNHEVAATDVDKRMICEAQYIRMNKNSLRFIMSHPEIPTLFVNYDDLVDRKLDHVICRFVGRQMSFGIINPGKRRSPAENINGAAMELYAELNKIYAENISIILLQSRALDTKGRGRVIMGMAESFMNTAKRIRWRLLDKTLQCPVVWRIKVTLQHRYGWEAYAKERNLPVCGYDESPGDE
jgi:hypothetical protein